ncbi:MAG: caspase family protein [Parafilimonas terrae]|nr:caspase family protein [Parafilimonas terrae]
MRFGSLALAFLCCLAGWVGAAAKDRALVVGVNHYPGIKVNGVAGVKDLGGAVFDGHTFRDLLVQQFHVDSGDIHTLFDADASRDRILGEFKTWLIDGTGPGDRVFFYYAGHGVAVKVEDPATGGSRMTSAIVPADASGELAASPFDIQGIIRGTEMRELLNQLPGRTVTVLADSCMSGSISRGIGNPLVVPPGVKVRTLTPAGAIGMTEEALAKDTGLRVRSKLNGRLLEIEPAAVQAGAAGDLAVWAAATTDQVTFDIGSRPGGIFTQSFADGLRDGKAVPDDKGHITAQALLNYVRDQAKQFCTQEGQACSAGLTPQLAAQDPYLVAPLSTGAVESGTPTPDQTGPVTTDGAGTDTIPSTGGPPPVPLADRMAAVLSHRNDFALSVDVLPSPRLKLGDAIHFRVTSGEAGRVAVFDITPDGDLTQVFPNTKTGRGGRIRANAPLTMPDAYWGVSFKATPPTGPGALLVLVTEEGLDLDKATGGALTFKPIGQPSRLMEIVSAELAMPVVSPQPDVPTRAPRWAFAKIPYSVAP